MHPHDCYSALEGPDHCDPIDMYFSGFEACTEQIKNSINFYIKRWIYGNVFAGMLYGAIVLITIAYLHILTILFRGKTLLSTQQRTLSMYIVVAFILSTLQIGGALQRTTKLLSFEWAWTVDIIMMWRLFIIYHDLKRTKWSVFVFSSLAFIGTGAYTAFIMSSSTGFDPEGGHFYLVLFEAVILLQNIMLITLIGGRLLLFRCQIQKVLGRCYENEYTSIASMVVYYNAFWGDPANARYGQIFYQVTGQIQVLSPMILIYRVMQGKMCNSQTIEQITEIRFKNDEVPKPNSKA
ncbi:hypothetical protein BDQ17DRAFT_1380765 [Cyathus striatus]|nr:hypothetical protein BDQ17DRAFT_1380765 [Cyathus striatus]